MVFPPVVNDLPRTTCRARISSLATYVPPKVLTNADLEKLVDTSDEWILQRTGIRERHIVEPGVATSDLATEAAKKAIERAGLTPEGARMLARRRHWQVVRGNDRRARVIVEDTELVVRPSGRPPT